MAGEPISLALQRQTKFIHRPWINTRLQNRRKPQRPLRFRLITKTGRLSKAETLKNILPLPTP